MFVNEYTILHLNVYVPRYVCVLLSVCMFDKERKIEQTQMCFFSRWVSVLVCLPQRECR